MDRIAEATNVILLRELAVWWAGIALQVTILARGRIGRLWRKYPLFYGQLVCSLFAALLDLWVFIAVRGSFSRVYWDTELLTALAGCGVLLEVLRQAFVRNGAALLFGKVAQRFLYGAMGLFAMLFTLGLYSHAALLHLVSLERDFRLVQTAILLGVVGAVFYFGLPLSKNLNGMLIGYGVFIACDLVTLALESHFPVSFALAGDLLQPLLYCASLAIYVYGLWTYDPGSPPKLLSTITAGDKIGADNQVLSPFDFGNNTFSG